MIEQERLLPAVLVRPQDWATIVDETGLSIVEGLQTERAILACERVFRSSITTAFCRDEFTSIEVEDLQRSYRAFCLRLDQLPPAIAWELYPDSLRNKFNEHWIHRVAKAKPMRGQPTKWRKREFRLRTLGLYAWAFGQIPSETPGGPTWRFMQATSRVLQTHLASEEDDHPLKALWKVPKDERFLRDLWKSNGGVDTMSHLTALYAGYIEDQALEGIAAK